ncbi:MAG: C/D box methylation guide ribonucleoprotein complex aNOP56 subunit [Candidatus Bathyarchaeota archaeon]|nr:C/D box methylation guide ribonucleoprotein complex aNOP56 subunit [Candidatus Bathyarchaeota archaeon]
MSKPATCVLRLTVAIFQTPIFFENSILVKISGNTYLCEYIISLGKVGAVNELKVAVIPSVMGILCLNEDGGLIDKEIFDKDPVKVAEKLFALEQGKPIPEIKKLIQRLKDQKYTDFLFDHPDLAKAIREEFKVNAEPRLSVELSEKIRENMGEIGVEIGFISKPSEITQWIRDVTIELSKIRIKKATEKRDLLIVQAVQALDDSDQTLNLFMSRLREWYGIHFPELSRLVEKHETYARLVYTLGRRDNFTIESLRKEGFPENKAIQIYESAKASMGADLQDMDIEQIQKLSKNILQLYEARANLEKYIDALMEDVAPNLRELAGPSLGARLIALAGGLENLAKMPASTVQVLGAEKALFRSLRTGAKPPKHGVIFQHSLVFRAKKWLRGKIARALAGKLSIAARTDVFTGNYIGDKLKEELLQRVREIEEKYPSPPKAKVAKKKAKRRGKK